MLRIWSHVTAILVALVWAQYAHGVDLRVAAQGSLLQQPTSHYYHYAYGINLDAAFAKSTFIVRTGYVQRPYFENQGFVDSEQAANLMVGSTAWNKGRHRIAAFFGVGWVEGKIIAKETSFRDQEQGRLSTVAGPALAAEYRLELGRFDLHATHSTIIGIQDELQLEARVAWPYNFYAIGMGTTW